MQNKRKTRLLKIILIHLEVARNRNILLLLYIIILVDHIPNQNIRVNKQKHISFV